jgi:hypothetical protein
MLDATSGQYVNRAIGRLLCLVVPAIGIIASGTISVFESAHPCSSKRLHYLCRRGQFMAQWYEALGPQGVTGRHGNLRLMKKCSLLPDMNPLGRTADTTKIRYTRNAFSRLRTDIDCLNCCDQTEITSE